MPNDYKRFANSSLRPLYIEPSMAPFSPPSGRNRGGKGRRGEERGGESIFIELL
jgi:hypothetical protein